ncbi:hypothetical protein DL346_08820 [Paenibacillus montanisoli]|uniref:Uncharacterized protein n=1 Tax=Paenibacillus montanisoli TaxID=2081970 RepID=A0A328UC59_9BACL|nr:hypothetical protein DL346_08820 [Paenibacillus montanisoli]
MNNKSRWVMIAVSVTFIFIGAFLILRAPYFGSRAVDLFFVDKGGWSSSRSEEYNIFFEYVVNAYMLCGSLSMIGGFFCLFVTAKSISKQ